MISGKYSDIALLCDQASVGRAMSALIPAFHHGAGFGDDHSHEDLIDGV